MRRIKMTIGPVVLEAELFETPTAKAIWNGMPFTSQANPWREEGYFSTPVKVKLKSDARDVVEPGELAFRVEGDSIAIGFGRMRISRFFRGLRQSPQPLLLSMALQLRPCGVPPK
jgi:hypothetical protein